MNINFERVDQDSARTHVNVDRGTTVYRGSKGAVRAPQNSFALDISGTVMDNNAYAGHGRTVEEVMQAAGQEDITARRNYMAVMSNTMSDEDFARLQKDGFHPGSTDIETVVTIVDRIKAALLKGGAEIIGYTDTLGDDQLREITGSETFARELRKQFERQDIPLTRQNAEAVMEAWGTMQEVGELPEGSVKYMVENELDPTVENLYTARYSAAGADRQGRGYYEAGAVSGYYAKKPEQVDFEKLMPQIEKVIERAGLPVGEDTVKEAVWLIEKGIPLNEDTLLRTHRIGSLRLPEKEEDFAASAAAAIADGTPPAKTDITRTESLLWQAASIEEKTQQIEERAVDIVLARELPFNLKNLFYIASRLGREGQSFEPVPARGKEGGNLQARRLLEEVRLSMTVTANLRLLRSGFRIETAPMEELIKKLKEAEKQSDQCLVQETDAGEAGTKSGLYRQTLFVLESIRVAPAAIAAQVSEENTLPEVEASGRARQEQYRRAEQSYEPLMTAPRSDLGDSIRKAFQNVDDILEDLGKEITEQSRKVIRIMGYNSMEMTEENFEEVRRSEALLTRIVDQMKPGTVLSMIREGVNPLTMSLEELEEYLNDRPQDPAAEMESYSRFLYKMEQRNDITEEERSAYIGIYRLLRQVEKGDDAALGAMMQTGAEATLNNLLTAVRSSRRKHMDYAVSDEFGGIRSRSTERQSITEQIEKGYIRTRQQLEEAVDAGQTKTAQAEYDHMVFEEVRYAAGSEDEVLRQLMNYGQSITADNLMAAGELLKGAYDGFARFGRLVKRETDDSVRADSSVEEGGGDGFEFTEFPDALGSREDASETYEGLMSRMQQALENTAFTRTGSSLDVRGMSLLYKQISFMKSMAREENYEMPVRIGGEVTAVNLKVIHGKAGESKVAVTMETQLLGRCAAEFTVTEAGLSGYGICSSSQGSGLMSQKEDLLGEMLAEEGLEMGDIRFIAGENLNLAEFSEKMSKDRIPGQTSDTLYAAAKAYIGFVQKISE